MNIDNNEKWAITVSAKPLAAFPDFSAACDFTAALRNRADCGRLVLLQADSGEWAVCRHENTLSGCLKGGV